MEDVRPEEHGMTLEEDEGAYLTEAAEAQHFRELDEGGGD
jgi:hypothetical protein